MRAVDGYVDHGECIGTPSDEGCSLRPSMFLLAFNEVTGQVALLGLCPRHEQERDEVQAFMIAAGFNEGYAYDWRRLAEVIDLVHHHLDGSVSEVGSSWSDLAAVG